MFALLATLCQSPASWYTSGPAQKWVLRQIKALDSGTLLLATRNGDGSFGSGQVREGSKDLKICLLMLYGHILATSASYTYSLSMSSSV